MSFLSKNYLLLKVIYLLIRCYKTRFFLWNKNNADKDGVHKPHTHTHTHTHKKIILERISMKISDTPPPFLNNTTYFTNLSIFMAKIWTLPFFFVENFNNSPSFQVPILFLKKINFSWWFAQSKHSGQEKIRFLAPSFLICVK